MGWGGRRKTLQVKTRGHTDGPDHATTLKGNHSGQARVGFQADNTQSVHSTNANMLVMVLQGCKSTPQKSRSRT